MVTYVYDEETFFREEGRRLRFRRDRHDFLAMHPGEFFVLRPSDSTFHLTLVLILLN